VNGTVGDVNTIITTPTGYPFIQIFFNTTQSYSAICITLIVTILLSLINIGSTVALLALTTLSRAALVSSYLVTISCVLLKRIRRQPLPRRRWSLGRYGMDINIIALSFLYPLFIFISFSLTTPVVPSTMNWSYLIFGSVILFATAYYVIYGRKHYIPPVSIVKREQYEM
jgi:amino acid transporter